MYIRLVITHKDYTFYNSPGIFNDSLNFYKYLRIIRSSRYD